MITGALKMIKQLIALEPEPSPAAGCGAYVRDAGAAGCRRGLGDHASVLRSLCKLCNSFIFFPLLLPSRLPAQRDQELCLIVTLSS